MARIRSIKPEFWTSEQVMECSPNARLMFIGLWNFCDDTGRQRCSPKQIKALIFPSDDMTAENIRRMFDELSANDLLQIYAVDGKEYFQVTGWHHQKIDKPQPSKYPGPAQANSRPLPERSSNGIDGEERRGEGEDRKGEEGKGKEERARGALAPGWPDDYSNIFWEAFPNKIGKKDALRKLDRVARSGIVSFADFITALDRYANKTDDRPFCNPATWINQERWTDVPATNGNGKRTIQQAAADQLAMFRAITGKDRTGNEAGDPPVRLLPARGRQ